MKRPSKPAMPRRAPALAAAFWLLAAFFAPAQANDAQKLIDDSASMLRALVADRAVWDHVHPWFEDARAVVLAPDLLEAGFLLGAAGGQCVMVARGPAGDWSPPSFCTFGEASFGLQLGFQKSEMLMMAMSESAMKALMAGSARFGGDAGLAAGLVGVGVKGGTTPQFADLDVVAVTRNQGFFGGIALDGGWVEPDADFNHAYYGQAVGPNDILVERLVAAPATEILSAALEKADQAGGADPRGE